MNTSKLRIAQSLVLPCGAVIKNRLGKSAMSERLGTIDNRPMKNLAVLFSRWAQGGAGLLITGNVMIDRKALGEPCNVAVENEKDLAALAEWAAAGAQNGTDLWMQINHPGKQAPRGLNRETVAPSAVPFRRDLAAFFPEPRELTREEIEEIILRFGATAAIAKKGGFTGVQIHGAHGYLVSQFLSPHHNRRDDDWGGSPERRMSFVLEVVREIRRQVGEAFPIGIKLNSADFQKGGFEEDESLNVLRALEKEKIDLIEISGGTYEAPVMTGAASADSPPAPRESTRQREAYFLEFAEKARKAVRTPLMLTGGFRTLAGINSAVESGAIDIAGMARLLAVEPDAPSRFLKGEEAIHTVKPVTTGIAPVDKMALMELAWYKRQIHRLGEGKNPKPDESALRALAGELWTTGLDTFRNRHMRA